MSDLELNAPDGNDDHPAVQAFLNRKEKPAMTIPEQAVEGTSEKIARLLAELKSERLLRDFEVRYAPGARRTLKPAAFELQDRIVELVSNSYKLDGSRQPLVGVQRPEDVARDASANPGKESAKPAAMAENFVKNLRSVLRNSWTKWGAYSLEFENATVAAILSALPPLRAREETARKTVWLVVRDGLYTEYRNAGSPNWVADPWRAAEYETFEAAEYARKQITFDEWRNRSKSIEHIFINRPKTIAPPKPIYSEDALSRTAGQEWRDIRDLLEDVITADQVHDWNNTAQDTARDGALARRARKILAAAPLPAPPVAEPKAGDVSRETLASSPDAPR